MSQLFIVTTPQNSGEGTPLSTAFNYTNSNFSELYARYQTSPPPTLVGVAGDVPGMYASDSNYFYYCFGTYDGTSVIWARVAQLANIVVSQITNGDSNVAISTTNGNITMGVGGGANLAVFSTTGAYVAGVVSATGNIRGSYIIGNGSQLTGLPATYNDSNVATFLQNLNGNNISTLGTVIAGNITGGNILTTGIVSATANITGNYILGNGSQLTGLPALYGNANVVSLLSSFGSNTISSTGNITTTANVSTGNTIASGAVIATGNVSGGNVTTAGNVTTQGIVSASGNIVTAGYFVGNFAGNVTGNLVVNGSNTQVLFNTNGNVDAVAGMTYNKGSNTFIVLGVVSGQGNIIGGNVVTVGQVSATGNVAGNYILGNGSQLTGLPALYSNANVAAFLSAFGSNTISTTGTINSGNVTGGNLATTGVATVAGNITGGNILTGGIVSAVAGIASNASVIALGNVLAGNVTTSGVVTATGTVTGGNLITAGFVSATGNISGRNLALTGNIAAGNLNVVSIGASGNITATAHTGTTVSVVGNVTGANVFTSGNVSATGYILGNVAFATGATYGNANVATFMAAFGSNTISTSGNVSASNLIGNISGNLTGTTVSVTGAITTNAGSLAVGNTVSPLGNIDVYGVSTTITNGYANANLTMGAYQGAAATTTIQSGTATNFNIYNGASFAQVANVTTAGVSVTGLISATGNIAGNYFVGNGSQLTGVVATGIGTLSSLSVIGNITAGNITATSLTGTTVSVTGTITGGNITATSLTGTTISVSGNITGGNLITAGTLTVNSGGADTAIINGAGNTVGNIGSATGWFNTLYATSSQALYADVAENYQADAEYAPGTVVIFGGDTEITVTIEQADERVAGAISTNPAYLMNSGEAGLPVALRGKVPVRVVGAVAKGDSLVTSTTPGAAVSVGRSRGYAQAVFAKALESNNNTEEKIILAVII